MKVELKKIANIRAGYPFRGKIIEHADSSIVAVQMKDVLLNQTIIWETCIKTELISNREPDWLQPNEILIAARGSKNYAVLVDESIITQHIQAIASPHFFVLKIEKPSILPSYLCWFLNQFSCQQYFMQNAEGTLTKSIRRNVLAKTPIIIPSFAQQHSIVKLASNMQQQQQLMQQLQNENNKIMNGIVQSLYRQEEIAL